ncbi:MAG TPA: MATE family efflux transporter [Bacteroidales bacterium]|nr:MATE family efflux transporter [Bacteroidales bacterium]
MAEKIPVELGTEKIGTLLRQYAVPAIIAMTASSLYNMVDSIFIGQGVGPLAISGLAVTFPLMNISAAFGTLVGAGGATLVSVLLGQRNYDMAKKVLANVFILNVTIGVFFIIFSLSFLTPILRFFGASDATLPYAKEYMTVILLGNIITHLYFGLNAILRSAGFPKKAMTATILTVVLNTILDPIFIFVFDMGIQGAAIATVLSQAVALVWVFRMLSDKSRVLHFSREQFSLDRKIAGRSLSIGMAPFLMNLTSSLVVILMNNQLRSHGGDMAIGAYGIINRVVFLFMMIVMGFTHGMQPIAGYNYGAKLYPRVVEVFRLTVFWATLITTLCFLVGMFFPEVPVSLFTRDPELKAIASRGFRIGVSLFPIVGFQMVTSNFFQSLGLARRAIFLSLSRQLLFLIPCLAILPGFFGVDGVWISMPVSDAIASIVAALMLASLIRKFRAETALQNIEEEPTPNPVTRNP